MILGIDQSITSTGICLTTNDLEIVKIDTLLSGKRRGVYLLDFLRESIDEYIGLANGQPLVVAREGYSYQSNTNNAFQTGEIGGFISYCCFIHGNVFDMFVFPPTTVKKFCLGTGSKEKDTGYLLKVFKETGIEFVDDNQADAFLLALTAKKMLSIEANAEDSVGLVDSLNLTQKETLVPASVAKRRKITKAGVKKLTPEELIECCADAMNGVFMCFRKEDALRTSKSK